MDNAGFTGESATQPPGTRDDNGINTRPREDKKDVATVAFDSRTQEAKQPEMELHQLSAQRASVPVSARASPLLGSSRLTLSMMSCLGFINMRSMLVNINITMVCMVNQTALDEMNLNNGSQTFNKRPSTCRGMLDPYLNSTGPPQDTQQGEFGWSKEVQGYVLGSFFWGFITTQVIGGWLAARYGGKRVYGYSMFLCAIVTLLTPISARTDYKALMVMRIIIGICMGMLWPSMVVLWTKWAPPFEYGTLVGFVSSGTSIGNVVTFPVASLLCQYGFDGGWPSVFYTNGICGVLWFIAWMYIVHDSPEEHPRISDTEREYIQNSLGGRSSSDKKASVRLIPWLDILTSPKVWAIVLTHICCNWSGLTFLTNTPTYLKEVLYLDVGQSGIVSALPYLGVVLTTYISGALYDLVVSKRWLRKTTARKVGNTLGCFVPALLVIWLGFMDCTQPTQAVALLVAGVAMNGCYIGAGFFTNAAQLSPHYAGIIFGISNTFATVSGISAPILIGYVTAEQTQAQWQIVFFIAAALYCFATVFFIMFGSAEIQPWDPALELQIQVDPPSQGEGTVKTMNK